jgi:hypothetical protein
MFSIKKCKNRKENKNNKIIEMNKIIIATKIKIINKFNNQILIKKAINKHKIKKCIINCRIIRFK